MDWHAQALSCNACMDAGPTWNPRERTSNQRHVESTLDSRMATHLLLRPEIARKVSKLWNHSPRWFPPALCYGLLRSSLPLGGWNQSFSPLSSMFHLLTCWFNHEPTLVQQKVVAFCDWLGKWHFFHLEMVLQVRYTRFTKETSHSLISHQPILYWPEMQTMDLSLMTSFVPFLGISWNTGAMTFMGQHISHLVWTTGLTPCYLPNSGG